MAGWVHEGAPREWLGVHQLNGPKHCLGEAALAVAEVELPQAAEMLVEPEGPDLIPILLEARTPPAQRFRVVRPDVLEVHEPQVRSGRRSAQCADRRHEAARKDVALDEVDLALLRVIPAVLHRDGLNRCHTVRRKQARTLSVVRVEILMAHGLDHLDRDQSVVCPAKVSIVAQQNRDAVLETRLGHALCREPVLLA